MSLDPAGKEVRHGVTIETLGRALARRGITDRALARIPAPLLGRAERCRVAA